MKTDRNRSKNQNRKPGKLGWGAGVHMPAPAPGDHYRAAHGQSGSPTHNIFSGIRARCYNTLHSGYRSHGAKGVRMADHWLGSLGYEWFVRDMGERPSLHHTIKRHDPDGDYTPDNCLWFLDPRLVNRRPRSPNKPPATGPTADTSATVA